MTLTPSLVVDVLIVVFLVVFALRGLKNGLIVTVFSLIALVVAIGCGWFLSTHYSDALANTLQPAMESKVTEYLERTNETPAPSTPLDMGYSEAFSGAVQSNLDTFQSGFGGGNASSLGTAISSIAARSVMFLAGFFAVMIVWWLLAHFLHLVTRFPGVHTVDRVLGAILGLLLGYLFLMLIRWVLCDLLGCVPESILAGSYLFPLLFSEPIFLLLGV